MIVNTSFAITKYVTEINLRYFIDTDEAIPEISRSEVFRFSHPLTLVHQAKLDLTSAK